MKALKSVFRFFLSRLFWTVIGLLTLCALIWFGISWGRWFLLGFIAWRAIFLGKVVASSSGSEDVLRLGALAVLLIYLCSAVVLASPAGRSNSREATIP